MIWIFIDETYDRVNGHKRFIVTATAVFANNWRQFHGKAQQIRNQPKQKWTAELVSLLDEAKGFVIINYADVPPELLPSGARDFTGDIKEMSRENNIWSQCVAFSVSVTMARLLHYQAEFEEAQIFYHQKSLKNDHRTSLKGTILNTISRIISDKQKELGYKFVPMLAVFEEIQDPKPGQLASERQNGVWISDHLCRAFRKFCLPAKNARIEVRNISKTIQDTFDRMKEQQVS